MNFTKSILNNRYAVWAIVIALAVFGAKAYYSIPMQLFPDTMPPLVNVITLYPGASARDVDETLTQDLEREFASIDGVTRIKSSSYDNMSVVSVEFAYTRDVDLAAVDVQNAIARIRGELPAGIREPQVLKFSTADRPVITIGVAAKDMTRARKMSEDVFAPLIQRIPGVAAADVFGGAKPAVLVDVDLERVRALHIPMPRIIAAIRTFNSALPAGRIRTLRTQTMFRMESRTMNTDALKSIPIAMPGGNTIRLGSIAHIHKGSLDNDAVFSINGRRAIAIQVFKTEEANTVKVVDQVEKTARRLEKQYAGMHFLVGEETATFTRISVQNLLSNVWQALLFAALIIFLFLGKIRGSSVAIVSMPLSYGMTFALMKLLGIEFNMVTLSAVILAVGMVVDASVVILENITRVRDEEGLHGVDAVVRGTDEVRLAVLAGTATTLVVLVPLLFLHGFTGKTFGPLSTTLIFAFTSSILVALVLVPVLSLYTEGNSRIDWIGEKMVLPFQWVMDKIKNGYVAILRGALRFRLLTIVVMLGLFAGSIAGMRSLGMETLPKMDSGAFYISLQTPSGSSLEDTGRVVHRIEELLKQEPDVIKVQSQAGFEQGMKSLSSFGVQGPTLGYISVTLKDRDQRKESLWQVEARVSRKIARIPGIRTYTVRDVGNTAKATTLAPIIVRISGKDPLVLDRLGNEVKKLLAAVPNVLPPIRNWDMDDKRVVVRVDKVRAAQMGLSPAAIARTMAMGSFGVDAGSYYGVQGTPIPVRVRYAKKYSRTPADLLNYPVYSPAGVVPLRAIARATEVRGQGLISREQLAPTLEVSAFTSNRPLNFIIKDVEKALKTLTVPRGYQVTLTGEKADLAESKHELGSAFLIAILAVYLLLVAQLRSFLHPITIMASIPLSLIGVFAALFIAGKTVSMPVMVGMILLAGTVVNNAIILLEFVRQKRGEGVSRREALLGSVAVRFRPIMMTSLSTIVGMIPLAAEWALGAERFSPLATAVIGGMTAATFLTLVFIPVLYDVFDDITLGLGRVFRRQP